MDINCVTMLASDFFTDARLKEMRDEIRRDGFVADKFLADKPNGSVFGVNLACLYPFPSEVHTLYQNLFEQLAALDPGVYVYPLWETHVTIATFINFTQHAAPTSERIAELTGLMREISPQLENVLTDIEPFDLWMEQPVISRKAAILPLSDPSGAISQIRKLVVDRLSPSLRTRLNELGLNIPPLVHSTILRFKNVPADTERFVAKFDEIDMPRTPMRVSEIYITTETKPYMREGEIFRRFPLSK